LQGEGFLVGFQEMVEADGAPGQRLRLVDGGLQQFVQGVGRGELQEAQSRRDNLFGAGAHADLLLQELIGAS